MKWHDDITFKQAKSDYEYIVSKYGQPCDFCGSLCNSEFLFSVLDGKITRKEAFIEMIQYIWDNGLEPDDDTTASGSCSTDLRPDENDTRIQEIKERYLID